METTASLSWERSRSHSLTRCFRQAPQQSSLAARYFVACYLSPVLLLVYLVLIYPLPVVFAGSFLFSFKRCCAAVAERLLCQSAQACGAHVLPGFGAAWEASLSQGAVGTGAVLITGLRRVSRFFLVIGFFSFCFAHPNYHLRPSCLSLLQV